MRGKKDHGKNWLSFCRKIGSRFRIRTERRKVRKNFATHRLFHGRTRRQKVGLFSWATEETNRLLKFFIGKKLAEKDCRVFQVYVQLVMSCRTGLQPECSVNLTIGNWNDCIMLDGNSVVLNLKTARKENAFWCGSLLEPWAVCSLFYKFFQDKRLVFLRSKLNDHRKV